MFFVGGAEHIKIRRLTRLFLLFGNLVNFHPQKHSSIRCPVGMY